MNSLTQTCPVCDQHWSCDECGRHGCDCPDTNEASCWACSEPTDKEAAATMGLTLEEYRAYDAHTEAEYQRHLAQCPAEGGTGGHDPWSWRCDLPRGHSGEHRCENPVGEDSGVATWN